MALDDKAPELTFIGKADTVVLGGLGPGDDYLSDFMSVGSEFQDDELPEMRE